MAFEDMQDIFDCALDLDLKFRESRAVFSVTSEISGANNTRMRHGFLYDTESMVLHPDLGRVISESMEVDMIVAPALVKQGNADGANYISNKILVKLTVVGGLAGLPVLHENLSGDASQDVSSMIDATEPSSSQYEDEEMFADDVSSVKSEPDESQQEDVL